jgi:3-methyladenine DNA glycosylase AlkD
VSENFFQVMESNGDPVKAIPMKAYMRDQFPFLGIPTSQRKKICAPFFKLMKRGAVTNWDFVFGCWRREQREFQYAAIDYLALMRQTLAPGDIPKLKALAVDKSWWDTIDGLDRIVGDIAFRYPEADGILLEWSQCDNFWLRRIAIDHQLTRKEKTNTALLEKIIVNNLGQQEFFINKAIGWSLREYSKTNPVWVRNFIANYRDRFAPLSIREASKYL